MRPHDYLAAVTDAFRAGKEGRAEAPHPLHIKGVGGAFHGKGAFLAGAQNYAALKLNANFPANPEKFGLPTIQGAILLFDADKGTPLAIMDSIEITLGRTAAASVLAASYLAKEKPEILTICGCGAQGVAQLHAFAALRRPREVRVWDKESTKAAAFATSMSQACSLPVRAVSNLKAACIDADTVITCTTSKIPFLGLKEVSPGTFIAAVGADNPEKSEIKPGLLGHAKVIVDILEQCLSMGDLRTGVAAKAMTPQQVHADLGDLVVGGKSGRRDRQEIFVFDSTGTALQDVTSAVVLYKRAVERDLGLEFSLFD